MEGHCGSQKDLGPSPSHDEVCPSMSLEARVGQECPGGILGRMAHSCIPSTKKAKAKGCVIAGQPGLQSETASAGKKKGGKDGREEGKGQRRNEDLGLPGKLTSWG